MTTAITTLYPCSNLRQSLVILAIKCHLRQHFSIRIRQILQIEQNDDFS